MNRFDEALRDLKRAVAHRDLRAVREIVEGAVEEAKSYEFEELGGQLLVYVDGRNFAGIEVVLHTMARKAFDADVAKGLAFGPAYFEGLEQIEHVMGRSVAASPMGRM